MGLQLTSSAFENNGIIPTAFTCDGEDKSPALSWDGIPEGAQSLVLIMDDPDIPESVKRARGITVFDHWVVFNIPPSTLGVAEGEEPTGASGSNSSGLTGYKGPCPPDREHRYIFRLYALDTILELSVGSTKEEVLRATEGHVLGQAELAGRYNRPGNR